MFPPFSIPSGSFTVVTDELSAPADFLLHQLVNGHLKDRGRLTPLSEGQSPEVLVLTASEDLNRWKAIASKMNVNLAQHISSKVVQFMDLSRSGDSRDHHPRTLAAAYTQVAGALKVSSKTSDRLVILDDISTLEWIGISSSLDIMRFVRALRALCRKNGSTLVVRYHITSQSQVPDDQLRQLLEICSHHLDVWPLYSGRSGAVSGEIALHHGAATAPSDGVKSVRRSLSLQYRLLDTGPVYFEKGTSEGVL